MAHMNLCFSQTRLAFDIRCAFVRFFNVSSFRDFQELFFHDTTTTLEFMEHDDRTTNGVLQDLAG